MKVLLKELWAIARERGPGFLDEVLENSKFDYPNAAIELSLEAHNMIDVRWSKVERRGLGDVAREIGHNERQRLIDIERDAQGSGCC